MKLDKVVKKTHMVAISASAGRLFVLKSFELYSIILEFVRLHGVILFLRQFLYDSNFFAHHERNE